MTSVSAPPPASRVRSVAIWLIVLSCTVMYVGAVWLSMSRDVSRGVGQETALDPVLSLSFLVWACVGGVLAVRRPTSPIGATFLGVGSFQTMYAFVTEYAVRAYHEVPGGLPLADVAAWLSYTSGTYVLIFLPLAWLWFPTGRPPSPRWRVVTWATIVGSVALVAGSFASWPYRGPALLAEPYPPELESSLLETVGFGAIMFLSVVTLVAGVSVLARYRDSRGVERQQLKLLAFAIGVLLVVMVIEAAGVVDADSSPAVLVVVTVPWLGVPLAVAVAMLRHNLFDIDRVISRTVSYALVTVVLAGVYALGVLGVGSLVPGGSSDLLVAGSTLVVAALFQPVRRRVQAVVDRRFNRARYDAQHEVAMLADRLRREVDLAGFLDELSDTVDRVMRPSTVSLVLIHPVSP